MTLSDDEIVLTNCYNFAVMRFGLADFFWINMYGEYYD